MIDGTYIECLHRKIGRAKDYNNNLASDKTIFFKPSFNNIFLIIKEVIKLSLSAQKEFLDNLNIRDI